MFVVGCLGDWRRAAAVLFERESVCRNPAPSREKRKVTPTLSSSGTGVSRVGFNCEDEWFIETPVVGTLDTGCGGNKLNHQTAQNGHIVAARMVAFGEYQIDGTASAMKARDYKDATDLVAQPVAFGVSERSDVGHCLRSNASKADKHESTTYVAQTMV